MASKEQRNAFAKETRKKFKKALEEQNWRRVDSCIQEMNELGFKAIANQMQKTREEAFAVDADAKKEESGV